MKIWIYGDSFTAGDGLLLPSNDVNFKNFNNNKFWGDYIKDYYKAEELINRGIGGNNNQVIYLQLLKDLQKFKPGDLVIVGNSFATRRTLPQLQVNETDLEDNKWEAIDSNNGSFKIFHKLLPITSDNDSLELKENLVHPDIFFRESNGRELIDVYNAMLNYISNVVKPTDSNFKAYDNLKVQLIFDFLKTLGIFTFLWNVSDLGTEFETYYKSTKGRVKDYHWSWKGSEDFGRYLTKKIRLK